jgi:hypothetical protein
MMACCIDCIQFSSYVTRDVIKELVYENGRWLSVGLYLVENVTAIKCVIV